MLKRLFVCSALVAGCHLWSATDPFIGHWTWNSKKSPHPTITYSVKDLGNNRFAVTGSTGETVNMQADGTLRPSPFGGTVSLKKINDHRWEMVPKRSWHVAADLYDLSR